MSGSLDGKIALITGGTGGIGKAICKRLSDQSMRAFTEQQQFIQESMEELVGTKSVKDMADLAQHNVELWMDMQKGFLKAAGLASGKSSSRKKPRGRSGSHSGQSLRRRPTVTGILLRRTKIA